MDLARQTFRNFEVIIVDARSDDHTVLKARQFQNRFERFRIFESEKKNGSQQRNLGAQKALADWLIFFDADNRLPEDFLQRIRDLVGRQNIDLLSAWLEPDSEDFAYKVLAVLSNLTITMRKNTASPLIREAFICAQRKAFLDLGGFDETVPLREGSELLKRAYQSDMTFVLCRNPKFICSYRR